MNQDQSRYFRYLGAAALLALFGSQGALAQKDALTSLPPSSKASERADYFACRKQALQDAEKKKNKNKAAKVGISQCQEQFPAAALFVECKRAALKKGKEDANAGKTALAECRSQYDKMNFFVESFLPFSVLKGKAFFGGAGLNLPRRIVKPQSEMTERDADEAVRTNHFNNFSCSVLEKTVFENHPAEFLLFGNELSLFGDFRGKSKEEILKRLNFPAASKKAAKKEKYSLHPRFGQVYGTKGTSPLIAYFPLSYCHFDRQLGKIFSGIKIYYLVDKERRYMTPYFGVAFYNQENPPSLQDLAQSLQETLGPDFHEYKNKKGVRYWARQELKEFDFEGDPLNLCREKNAFDFIALLKADKSQKRPEYLVLSNVGNLCKYGNRLASGIGESAAEASVTDKEPENKAP